MKTLERSERAAQRAGINDGETTAGDDGATRAIVIVPVLKGQSGPQGAAALALSSEERLEEAVGLAIAIGLDVAFSGTVPLAQIKPAALLGTGKVEEIGAIIAAEGVSVAIVDHPLTPIQQRNLEKAWNAKVLDRTGLILEIFAERARSKEGRLQVELARLTYQKSRLVRSWTHLERQRGGFGFLGGPGETQIEADRRAIGERIDVIKNELAVSERTRRLHRKRRKETDQQIVSLVGYTNAGKSTLFNALSGAGVLAKDMLFATLDPTLRRVEFADGGAFILSDTVGFISDLPTQLIVAFHATLEEILEADLILHVRDIASASSEAQKIEVERVLAEIGIDAAAQASRVIEVWNKSDLLSEDERAAVGKRAENAAHPAVLVSAQTGEGVPELAAAIRIRLQAHLRTRDVVVGEADGAFIHWLYENTEVIDRQGREDGSQLFQVRVAPEREHDLDLHIARPGT
ncbi:GTPase HflX [Rhodomicrobium vannielii ATCC 17100]|uniref:GTPase HflX n=1 Tax=Rhodomicrobium vannielii TaxID=1069 RepID=UPI001919805B|nr:GTPase HflX [Rhodomicrobium vannielii]MBJ7534218.1 GTPase HflX [Rhodomicrobium vannielii ATCC 17100]